MSWPPLALALACGWLGAWLGAWRPFRGCWIGLDALVVSLASCLSSG